MSEKYRAVIIGSGPGGYVAAVRLGNEKARAAVVEKGLLGGACLNVGCIPTKALLHSSGVAAQIKGASEYGIEVSDWKVDLAEMMGRKDAVVKRLRGGVGMLLKSRKADVYAGRGRLADTNKVEVELNESGKKVLEAENIIIATGSEPIVPKSFPQDRSKVMTSNEILNLQELPASLLIVGGGYIGCEFATMFSELGSRVIVVEMLERLLPMGDTDISTALAKSFKKRGIEIHCPAVVEKMELAGAGVKATLGGGAVVETTQALVCTGRRPLSGDLGLAEVGIKTEKGYILVDERCRTNIGNIYAIGDVTGKQQLAHVASRQAAVAANNILGRDDREDYKVVPAAVYTHPEIASVGLTQEQAQAQGLKVRSATFSLRASGLAAAYGATDGFVKLIADEDDAIVGAHLMCPHASDVVQEVAVLMKSECTLHELAATIHGHPTFAESLAEATEMLWGYPLHG